MFGMSIFEIVSKKGEKCPFWSQPAISSKERHKLGIIFDFFHPLGAMSDNFCCGLFVLESALMSLVQFSLENAISNRLISYYISIQHTKAYLL